VKCQENYPVIGGQPVLIDFDDSIVALEELEAGAAHSAIQRGNDGGLRRRLTRTLLLSNAVTRANASRFIALLEARSDRPKVLVVGGGSRGQGTERLYEDPALQLVAFDIYRSEMTHFIADAHRIPLADCSVDAVWIQAVLEHVLDPWQVVREIERVLRPEGVVYAETPFMQQVHEGAYDFTRFTESGQRWLFRRFRVVKTGVVLGPGDQLLWSIEHMMRGVFRSVRAGVAAKLMLFWVRYLDHIISEPYASDGASAVYFLGTKSESVVRPRDMVSYYRGAHGRRAKTNRE
jgi:ubiquinone/menaquinone biosynthesis C-methylase UbiE